MIFDRIGMSCFDTWQFVALKMTSITEEFQCFVVYSYTKAKPVFNPHWLGTWHDQSLVTRSMDQQANVVSCFFSFFYTFLWTFFFCALTWKGTVFQYLVSTFPFLGLLHSPHTPMPKSSCFNPRNVLNFFFLSFDCLLSAAFCFLFPFFPFF